MITDTASLERTVGSRPKALMLKDIPFLDEHCRTLLRWAPIGIAGWFTGDAVGTAVVGGDPGAIEVLDDHHLRLPGLDPAVPPGARVGFLGLVPGYGETLRVNGRATGDGVVEVDEAFLHCAKAVIRSDLWTPNGEPTGDNDDWEALLARAPFVALASLGAQGADVSPKGDPAGFVTRLDDGRFLVPDRRGNRRTDTLHNLLDDPHLGVLALLPGEHRVIELRTTATITDDRDLLAPAAVQGRTPKAGILLTIEHAEVRTEPGLVAGRPWDDDRRPPEGVLPRASCVWVDHVKANRDPSLLGRAARRVLTEGMMAKGTEIDYERNLY